MNGSRVQGASAGDAYVLLPQPPSHSHARHGPQSSRPDPARIKIIEASLREMRLMAAQSPASMSFSNFHSLLMLPDFPRPAVVPIPANPLPPQNGAGAHVPATQAAGSALQPNLNGNGAAAAAATRALPPLPPRIPHKLTPWEELTIRRDSEQRPYRDLYMLTGKRRRKHYAHPSWADGGIILPLTSSKRMDKVEGALRLGLWKVDVERLIAGGAGSLFAPDRDRERYQNANHADPAAVAERRAKRRRREAGYEIGVTHSSDAEIDQDVLELGHPDPSSLRSIIARSVRGNGGVSEDSDVESVYDSEVDEWEVEVAHAVWLRSHAHSASPAEANRRKSKVLAVPLSSNPTLLQVPLSEAERQAWNEEARQQRKLRLAEEEATRTAAIAATATAEEGSQTQRDPESTLPLPTHGRNQTAGPSQGGGDHGDELEATLAIASEQMLYELTAGSKDDVSTQATAPFSPTT
ncbi:unnamed protein product [Tilletia laevis]|uniref:Uncharacterized protein n=3 Tax=Tilletia TaxID=13289 RepID=A0A9N8M670_9BASI|nr:hypothetical protein CF336_g4166 [Tilletia laevis]KAE8262906.1 hypothetical protein A4X03_0g2080 [Tilletia caries]CAD6890398.1 unnamed protein product [Tilletia caries]CAD6948188.1 unnamed protein product [Tilletia laevis]CAD6955760.1 unnamed protein product [Tilletia laevis]